MATKITDGNHGDVIQGSPEKRLDIGPDGTLWALIETAGPGRAKFFRSLNGGTSWSHAASSDISLGQDTALPSFFIDADGFAHVCWIQWDLDPQVLRYARGRPTGTTSSDRGWSWTTLTISPASGRMGVDSDLVAFRSGTGWVVFIEYTLSSGGSQVARVNVSGSGTLTVGATTMGPSSGTAAFQFGSLEFAHNGDGKTPLAAPDLYLATGVQGSSTSVRLNRAVYSGGVWTWGTPVVVASANLLQTALCTVWDGSRLMTAYSPNSSAINVYEWDGVAGSATARNPPAAPGGTGNVLGLSLSHDPATDNIYLAYYDATDGDIRWSKFTRGANTWSAWAVSITRPAQTEDGKVQLVRHPSRDAVDMVYANGSGSSWQVYHQQLDALVRTPTPPTLISPASGANLDLAAGATFVWAYNPVSPGDTQQAWAFRRIHGVTTEYWNAGAQSWGGSITWNTGSDTSAAFGAGAWPTATTYTWSVRTRSSTGADSSFATDRTVVATTAPVVEVTAPNGITYADSTPLVEWTYTGLDPQRDFRVRIIEEQAGIDPDVTTPVWDSGVVSSAIARDVRVGTALVNGSTYRAYVQSTSSAAVTSSWDYSPFTISITPPAGPLVEVFDEIYYETGVPRVRLDVTARSSFLSVDQNDGSGGWENDTNTTITQQPVDTANQIYGGWNLVSLGSGLMGVRTVEGDPPLAPYGQPQPDGPLSFPVVAGQVYTGVASLKAETTTRAARIRLRWYDADDGTGSVISESVGDQEVVGTLAYGQAVLTATAPTGAVLVRMVVEVLGAVGAGEEFYLAFPSLAPGRSTVWQPGGYSATQVVRIERSDDGGVTWATVVDRLKPSLAQIAVGSDRLMPFGVDVKYRAYTDVDPGDGAVLSSGVSPTATINVEADRWGVRDVDDDLGELYAYVVGHKRGDTESSSVHRPGGREYPIVDTEGIQAATGTLSIFVPQADIDAAIDVLRRVVPMVIQSPSGTVFLARLIRRDYTIEQLRHRVIDVDYVEIN